MTVVITHDSDLAAQADRVLILVDGRIVTEASGNGRSADAQ